MCLDILAHGGQGTDRPAVLQLTAWFLVKDTHMVLGFFFFFGRLNCIFLVLTCRVQPDVAVAPLGLGAFFLILNWRIYIQDTQTFN